MKLSRRSVLGSLMIGGAAASMTACGTILHPERKGQRGGRIDPSIAILDGIGLLFFFIPGVIAFAVDFSNGTIYLPGTQASTMDGDIKQSHFDGPLTEDKLDRVWQDHYGQEKPFAADDLQRIEIEDETQLSQFLKRYNGLA